MSSEWKKLESVPEACQYAKPQLYTDILGKEWILFLGTLSGIVGYRGYRYHTPVTRANRSYCYDIKNDKYIPFTFNYNRDLASRFIVPEGQSSFGLESYVIDHKNHILYWFDGRPNSNRKYQVHKYSASTNVCSIASIDIKNLQDVKLLNQWIIDRHIWPHFINCYQMLLIGNKIHFIFGPTVPQHYVFDVTTRKLELVDAS